jgi:hypothetical protein
LNRGVLVSNRSSTLPSAAGVGFCSRSRRSRCSLAISNDPGNTRGMNPLQGSQPGSVTPGNTFRRVDSHAGLVTRPKNLETSSSSCGSFPLTLTLSLRERGQPAGAVRRGRASGCTDRHGLVPERRSFLPLPREKAGRSTTHARPCCITSVSVYYQQARVVRAGMRLDASGSAMTL